MMSGQETHLDTLIPASLIKQPMALLGQIPWGCPGPGLTTALLAHLPAGES